MVWDLYTPLGKRKSSMTTLENITLFMASLLKPHPGRDWMIIFILTLMIGIACMVIAGYLFIGIRSGTIVGESYADDLKPPQITRGEIEKVLETSKARALNFNERNFPLPTLFDPSK